MTWTSTRKAAYDSIVAQAPAPAEAVQIMIDFEVGHGLTTPPVTSAPPYPPAGSGVTRVIATRPLCVVRLS